MVAPNNATYDAAGRRASMTDPDNAVTSYQYNAANRLTSLTNPFNETATFQYDAAGRPVRQDNANGTYSTWAFDAAGQVSNVATKKADNSAVLNLDHTRDAVGNPTTVAEQLLDTDNQTTHNATLTFGYDNANRLTQEKRSGYEPIWYEYAMDGAGNRTQFVEKDGAPPGPGQPVGTTNATYSADNRLLTYGNMTFGYDGNGNRTSKTVNQVTTTLRQAQGRLYAYNHDNRLTELHDGATLTFSYNGDGLRQSRTVDGTTTQYVYDGVRLLKELDAAGATQTTYTLAPVGGDWHPLISHRDTQAPSHSAFYAFDALGTTRALTNQSQLTTHQFTDDAYGNVLTATDPAATPHQYIGKLGYYADAASGLQLLTQRYYDPGVGRFVTEDPVREGGNWSGYAGAQPLTTTDPSGLGCWDKGWNDPSCWWYHMQQRETWCQQHWYYCYMHGYLRCFWNCFPRRVLMPVLVISATWRQAYQQLMAVQQELSFAQHMISSGALTGVTGVSLAQIYERIAVLGAEVSRLQGVLRTIPRFSAATVIVYELYCVWRCYGSS